MKAMVVISCVMMIAGCNVGSVNQQPDAMPLKLPPIGKPSDDTTPGCQGIPASGTCQNGAALRCDTAVDTVLQIDCRALGEECVLDPDRGASCTALENLLAPNPSEPCNGVINQGGYCSADGKAVWCDTQSNQIYTWSCEAGGLSCAVDGCQSGAYCCEAASAPPTTSECERLGFYGECSGQTARYCTGTNTLVELDCAARGQQCALDVCAEGAYCCNPPSAPTVDCAAIGLYGECAGTNNNTARFCIGNTAYEQACTGTGQSCMYDVCFNGAACCTQSEYQAACQSIGFAGRCGGPDGNTVVWCNGQGVIERFDCGLLDQTCGVNVCANGADCC